MDLYIISIHFLKPIISSKKSGILISHHQYKRKTDYFMRVLMDSDYFKSNKLVTPIVLETLKPSA